MCLYLIKQNLNLNMKTNNKKSFEISALRKIVMK